MQPERTAPPLRIGVADELSWHEEAELVIVGFGGGGIAAAIEARERGASVIAVDRFEGGGATALSGGVVYAGGTRYQRESGFEDSPDEMRRYLEAEGSAVGSDTLRRFCEGSAADIEWLDRHGVPHGSNAFLEKTTFPPDPHWLYYSGNEVMPAFAAKATPAPRGHRTVAPGFLDGGKVMFAKLREAASALEVRLLKHSPVTRLVLDAEDRVVGIEVNAVPTALWQKHQALYRRVAPYRPFNSRRAERAIAAARELERGVHRPRLIRARGGVVLTTGGFIYNLPMLDSHRPELVRHQKALLRLGCLADDGSGIDLGRSAGAATGSMDHVSVARAVAPPNVFARGVMVNSGGRRFVNEAAYAVNVGNAILEQPGSKAWLLLEARDFRTGVRKSFFPGKSMFLAWGAPALLNIFLGGTRRGRTLERLARKLGADEATLIREVARFNEVTDAADPDPLGKLPELMHPLREGPFYAVDMSLGNRFCPAMAFTVGGLKLDEETGAVIRDDGAPIPGLYAAGRVAVGLPSNGYVSGLSLADTVFSGRRAAQAIIGALAEHAA